MKSYKRKSVSTNLKDFCYFAKVDSTVEVTEWANGEGFDLIYDNGSGRTITEMTYGEYDALVATVKLLQKVVNSY